MVSNMKPTISCIVPTHNRDEFMARAVASIQAQTLPPSEIIVSDDTGSDATRRVVETLAGDSPIPLRYVDSSGLGFGTAGASRNAGAAKATGDYIACLDDDDTWKPTFLEATFRELRDNPATELAVTWAEQVRDDKRWGLDGIRAGHTAQSAISPPPDLSGSNFLITRAAWDAIDGFAPEVRVMNDTDFFVRYLETGRQYCIVTDRLLERHIHDLGHLTTKSLARAKSVEDYYRRYESKMTHAQAKELRRVIHAQRRVADPSFIRRSYHFFAQLFLGSPLQPFIGLKKRILKQGFTPDTKER